MKPIWRKYLIIWFGLALLTLPLYFLDQALFKPTGGSNWITLDFRGLLFWSYIAWLAIYVGLSSIALLAFRRKWTVALQLGLMAISLCLLVLGFVAYAKLENWATGNRYRASMESRKPLGDVIELKAWQYFPDDISPAEIHVTVAVHDSGRFAGNVIGRQTDATGWSTTVFQSINQASDQKQVTKGQTFTYVFPLQIMQNARADDVSIALYLFKAPTGPATGDIEKMFVKSPQMEDDGQYFYGILPPPSQPSR